MRTIGQVIRKGRAEESLKLKEELGIDNEEEEEEQMYTKGAKVAAPEVKRKGVKGTGQAKQEECRKWSGLCTVRHAH
eukprot:7909445-Karenia_brevis.AAC.1